MLIMAWIITLKNQLWKHWLKNQYGELVRVLCENFSLKEKTSWRPEISAEGKFNSQPLIIKFKAGQSQHKLIVKVGSKKQTFRPDIDPYTLINRINEMLG